MAHFYGMVRGKAKTEGTREGSEDSGLTTIAASWEGSVKVNLYERNGIDYAYVTIGPHMGGGGRANTQVLYNGPINPNQSNE